MSGTELVYNLFAECQPGSPNTHQGLCVLNPPQQAVPVISAIAVALVIKGALTIVTFGIKLPAGIFIPSLGGKSNTWIPRCASNLSTQLAHVQVGSSVFLYSGCNIRIPKAQYSGRVTAISIV